MAALAAAGPTTPDANLRYQDALDWRKWTKGGCSFLLCPRSFDRAVMVAQWYDLRLETRETRSCDYLIDVPATPTLPDANLRYKEALDWRKWTKGGCSFLLLSAQF